MAEEDAISVDHAKAKELWDSLESKYMAEDASSKKFLFVQHNLKMDEYIYVYGVIDKLPPSWKDFKHTLKHNKDDMTLVELGSHFRIEEALRTQEIENNPKGKNQVGDSSVNMVEDGGPSKKSKDGKGDKQKFKENYNSSNKKPKMACWKCGKPGHFKKDYRVGKGKLEKQNAGPSGSKDPGKQQGNKKYVVTFIDDASRYCYVYLLHAKDEAVDFFKIYKEEVELHQSTMIKNLRTDRGEEYYDPECRDCCKELCNREPTNLFEAYNIASVYIATDEKICAYYPSARGEFFSSDRRAMQVDGMEDFRGHNTDEFTSLKYFLERFVKRGLLNDYLPPQDRQNPQHPEGPVKNAPPRHVIDMIVGPLTVTLDMANQDVRKFLIDSGSSIDVIFKYALRRMSLSSPFEEMKFEDVQGLVYGFGNHVVPVQVAIDIPTTFGTSPQELLREFPDIFAWKPVDMHGLDESVAIHRLHVDPNKAVVKKKIKKFAPERQQAIDEEINKLFKANFIFEIQFPEWISNVVLVKKANGKWRVCIDYTNLNKATSKDYYLLPIIDQLVDDTVGNVLFSFLDTFLGYNQIKLALEDQAKTAFITHRVVYAYRVLPMGLMNAGATY
ncbi:hypothetical protein AgCh_033468 [Apium graveolens]